MPPLDEPAHNCFGSIGSIKVRHIVSILQIRKSFLPVLLAAALLVSGEQSLSAEVGGYVPRNLQVGMHLDQVFELIGPALENDRSGIGGHDIRRYANNTLYFKADRLMRWAKQPEQSQEVEAFKDYEMFPSVRTMYSSSILVRPSRAELAQQASEHRSRVADLLDEFMQE